MTRLVQLLKFTVLGIVSVIIYFLDLSKLLNEITNFVFFTCLTIIALLSVQIGYERHIKRMKIHKEFIPKLDNSLKTSLVFDEVVKTVKPKKLTRYYAQEKYRWIGTQGQIDLGEKTVAVVGLGNPGVSSAELLVRAGIGELKLVDEGFVDTYDILNSKAFKETDLERPRALALEEHLQRINRKVTVEGHRMKPVPENISVLDSDLVLDFSNDPVTRQVLNRFCRSKGISLMSMDISATHGSIMIVGQKGPCLECQSRSVSKGQKSSIITEHMGSALVVMLALQVLLKKFMLFDVLSFDSRSLEIVKSLAVQDPECVVCGERQIY